MKELVEYIAKSIVEKPEEVKVTETAGEGGVNLRLEVAPEDMGKVIGKQGRIIQAIRTLVRVVAVRTGTRVELKVGPEELPQS